MAHWTNFCEMEKLPPELLVGIYDQWLSQLPSGPTQAERVLIHTDVMETAHERRFALSQCSWSMLDFQIDHCRRIEHYVDYLQAQVYANSGQEIGYQDCSHDPFLIGLASTAHKNISPEPLSYPQHIEDLDLDDVHEIFYPSLKQSSVEPSIVSETAEDAISVDEGDISGEPVNEIWTNVIQEVGKLSRPSDNKPRQIRTVRFRQAPIPVKPKDKTTKRSEKAASKQFNQQRMLRVCKP